MLLDSKKSKLHTLFLLVCLPIFTANRSFAQTSDSIKNSLNSRKFQADFQEKYRGAEFIYETKVKPEELSSWDKFWRGILDFLRRLLDFSGSDTDFSIVASIFKVLFILLICFVVYRIVKVIINYNGGFIFGKKNKAIGISNYSEEDIHNINFSEIIAEAKVNQDYRVAVRYYYLWLLKTYTDKEIIEWDIEKTNRDYANEIQRFETKSQFQYLSYLYDYIWYGEFSINDYDFAKAETKFLTAINE